MFLKIIREVKESNSITDESVHLTRDKDLEDQSTVGSEKPLNGVSQ